jgi:hypothetical protein
MYTATTYTAATELLFPQSNRPINISVKIHHKKNGKIKINQTTQTRSQSNTKDPKTTSSQLATPPTPPPIL